MLTTLSVDDCELHLEAFAVDWIDDTQVSAHEPEIAALRAAVGADGPWETTTIGGREYVLVATPYSA